MRRLLLLLILSLSVLKAFAQENFTFNKGTIKQEHYFSKIKYQSLKGLIIIPVIINGKVRHFILDTGAPLCISQDLQNELKLTTINTISVGDQSGKSDSMGYVSVPDVQIGGINFIETPALVIDNNNLILECFNVDGLIGSNMLRNSVVQFLSTDSSVIITDQIKNLNIQNKRKVSSKMILSKNQSKPFISIYLENDKTRVKETLLFDSGMDGFYDLCLRNYKTFAPYHVFKTLAQTQGSSSYGLHGEAEDTTLSKILIPDMQMNGTHFKDIVSITTSDDASRVGSEILKYGAATLDFKKKKFYFSAFKSNNNVQTKTYPVSLQLEGNKFIIGTIWDKNKARGINLNDEVLQVDDMDMRKITPCEYIQRKESDTMKLTVKKADGSIVTRILKKE